MLAPSQVSLLSSTFAFAAFQDCNKKYSRNSGDLSKEFIVENTLGTLTQKTFIQKLAVVKMMSIKWVYKVHDPIQEDTTI